MDDSNTQSPRDDARIQPFRFSRVGIFLLGVIAIPFTLTAALNSYGALTEASVVRMAFAAISGQTVAILSGVAIVAITIARRAGPGQVAVVVIIAVAIVANAISVMFISGGVLLARLELIAEIGLLGQ